MIALDYRARCNDSRPGQPRIVEVIFLHCLNTYAQADVVVYDGVAES